MGGDYMEVHYEDAVLRPRETLARISQFIEQDLDCDRIQQVALGSLQNPNSSFRGDGKEAEAQTIGRWKKFAPEQIRGVESLIGDLLTATGYELATPKAELSRKPAISLMSFLYPLYWDFKLWLKSNTPLARIADTGRMGIAKRDAGQ
jgi:hypothetical protein